MMTNNIGQSTKNVSRKGVAELFSSSTMTDLLNIFFLHSTEEFYQRELSRLTGNPLYLVQRELVRMERAGIIRKEKRGNRVYYAAQNENPAFLDLKRFFMKTIALGDRLSEVLAPLSSKIDFAFIYGSVAAGEDKAESDIDILVVGRTSLKELSMILGQAGRELGREINPNVYSVSEFKKRAGEGNSFLKSIIEGHKIWLIGDPDKLAEFIR